jgi:formate/nitrite transporter
MEAFLLGIFCNWLVCLAIWMAVSAKETAGKILAMFFPIWIFVTAGFEHSIANMFYIPAGLFVAELPQFAEFASEGGRASLTWENFFVKNLLPVTLGNTVSGGIFVALAYGFVHRKSL